MNSQSRRRDFPVDFVWLSLGGFLMGCCWDVFIVFCESLWMEVAREPPNERGVGA